MNNKIPRLILFGAISIGLWSCGRLEISPYQLIITNASIFDSVSGQVLENKTVFVRDGMVVAIDDVGEDDATLENAFDAQGKLLVPSFVDVHSHLNFVFGESVGEVAPENYAAMQSVLSEQYLPYGVTTVRSAGGREEHRSMELAWTRHSPNAVDYFSAGGALVSVDTGFYNHAYVRDRQQLVTRIQQYQQQGIQHLKLYSLLGEEHARTAINLATHLGMNVFGHIENAMLSIESASALGLNNFEHVKTLYLNVLKTKELRTASAPFELPPDDMENWRFREYEIFRLIGAEDKDIGALVSLLKENEASVTPTLHLYAQPIGLTSDLLDFAIPGEDQLNWVGSKLERAKQGYTALAKLTLKLYESGITLNAGSDINQPGMAILSELLLLNDLGIPMRDVLTIASLNGARSSGLTAKYGSIETGKRANMIIFDDDPLANPTALLSRKWVIKDGSFVAESWD